VIEMRDEDVLVFLGLGALVFLGLSMKPREEKKKSFVGQLRSETEKAVKTIESTPITEEQAKQIESSVSYVIKKLQEVGIMPQPIPIVVSEEGTVVFAESPKKYLEAQPQPQPIQPIYEEGYVTFAESPKKYLEAGVGTVYW
jgi:hypothetical protein